MRRKQKTDRKRNGERQTGQILRGSRRTRTEKGGKSGRGKEFGGGK